MNEQTMDAALSPAHRIRFDGLTMAFVSVVVAAYVILHGGGLIDDTDASSVNDVLELLTISVAAVLTWRVSHHPVVDSDSRRAWHLTTLAYVVFLGGSALWFYYSSILGEEAFPSAADIGYLAFYPLMLAALLNFPTAPYDRSGRLKFGLDVAIVMVGGGLAVWSFVVQPTLANAASADDWVAPAIAVSYTVGDMVLFTGIATVLMRRALMINRTALTIIIIGLVNMFVADVGFAYLSLSGEYKGHWINILFITGNWCLVFASYYQHRLLSRPVTAAAETAEVSEWQAQGFSWLPYLAVAIGFGILLIETREFWGQWLGLIVFGALGLTFLVVLRQIVSNSENVRLQAESLERRSAMRFQTLVQNSSDLITIVGDDEKIRFESPAIANVLGYEPDELVGSNPLDLVHPDDGAARTAIFEALLAGEGNVVSKEFRFRHKNGSWRTLETVNTFFVDALSNEPAILVNSRDVTKRNEDEQRLRSYNARLERSNRELQDFAYVASHDLQEPLRKVQAFGDRLSQKYSASLTDEGADYIRRMRQASLRMQTLINDLLTFSRVTTKARPFTPTDLNSVVGNVLSDLEIRIDELKARVEIGDLPRIEADELQMHQLFQNLIGNALKFHQKDVLPVVRVHAEEAPDPNPATNLADAVPACRIVVEDNGIGFDEKYLDRIFTVFQRLHGRGEYEGSGVGLAVCRKIVERHNGDVTASSSPGKGAKFIITLPLEQRAAEELYEQP
ncbi:MAG: PAS domain S-box protein [Acidobacteria bacterium]|nr:PAS domain S-box protein [Acidobacteriota bacterium]